MALRRNYDPTLTEPQLGAHYCVAVIHELDASYGRALVDAAIEDVGLNREYIEDPSHWTSVKFMSGLCDAIARRTLGLAAAPPYADPMWQHWRHASWRMLEDMAGSLYWLLLWAMERPSLCFAHIAQIHRTANAVTAMEMVAQGPGWTTLSVRETPNPTSRPAACWSRIGQFERLPEIWGHRPAVVEHEHCVYQHSDAPACIYTIRYDETGASDPAAALAGVAARLRVHVPAILRRGEGTFRAHRLALLTQRKVAHYLPPIALRRVEENPEAELALGGLRCEGAVLFADIFGFTSRCVTISPERTVEHLNIYFEHMDAVVAEHGGIVDKRIGDGMMVVFVVVDQPLTHDQLAAAAIRCGLAMLARLPRCNLEIARRGGEALNIRVGVAAGPLVQGNIGSHERMEYTVIGETVNLAARLEAAASPGRLLTLADCLGALPALAATGSPCRITAKGLGEIEAIEIDPATLPADP